MEQSPLEKLRVAQIVNNSSFLTEPKVHYCVHKGLPLDPILSRVNPVHILKTYF
jgi:hypothetical protein